MYRSINKSKDVLQYISIVVNISVIINIVSSRKYSGNRYIKKSNDIIVWLFSSIWRTHCQCSWSPLEPPNIYPKQIPYRLGSFYASAFLRTTHEASVSLLLLLFLFIAGHVHSIYCIFFPKAKGSNLHYAIWIYLLTSL